MKIEVNQEVWKFQGYERDTKVVPKDLLNPEKGEVLNGVLEEICTSTSSFEQDDVIVMIIGDNEFAGDRRI